MEKFILHTGVCAPILINNIDTDTIIPSFEMKKVSKLGLSEGLFSNWRYSNAKERELSSDFILNQEEYANTSIILAGDNFGCGSSREHAVWALKEFGIRSIIAPSFGSIFFNNCIRNGILPIALDAESIAIISDWATKDPQQHRPSIDLKSQKISLDKKTNTGVQFSFAVAIADKEMLINGLDNIAVTLQHKDAIETFRQEDQDKRPWIYL